jgi:hypothetical protein
VSCEGRLAPGVAQTPQPKQTSFLNRRGEGASSAALRLPTRAAPASLPVSMWLLFKEFLLFLRQEKKWWLVPLILVLLLFGALIIFSSGSVLAPLMYPFM